MLIPPIVVKREVREATERWRLRQASKQAQEWQGKEQWTDTNPQSSSSALHPDEVNLDAMTPYLIKAGHQGRSGPQKGKMRSGWFWRLSGDAGEVVSS